MLKDFIHKAQEVNGKLVPKKTSLEQLILRTNQVRRHFGDYNLFSIDHLDAQAAKELHHIIDCEMSPENLWGDGMLSQNMVNKKRALYNGARKELVAKGFPKGI